MAGVLEQLQAAARHRLVSGAGVLDGDDRVGRAPDDQRGHRRCQIEAVERAHPLPAGIEHRTHRVDERRARLGIVERGIPTGELVEVGPELQPQQSERAGDGFAHGEQPRVHEQRQDQLRAGQGRGAKQRMDLAPEPAAGDEYEALAALRELIRELHRDPAAERVTDDRRPLVTERDHRVADRARVGAERVVAARFRRLAVAEQVGREHGVLGDQMLDRGVPLVRAAGDPVDQDHQRALAAMAKADPMAVQLDLFVR